MKASVLVHPPVRLRGGSISEPQGLGRGAAGALKAGFSRSHGGAAALLEGVGERTPSLFTRRKRPTLYYRQQASHTRGQPRGPAQAAACAHLRREQATASRPPALPAQPSPAPDPAPLPRHGPTAAGPPAPAARTAGPARYTAGPSPGATTALGHRLETRGGLSHAGCRTPGGATARFWARWRDGSGRAMELPLPAALLLPLLLVPLALLARRRRGRRTPPLRLLVVAGSGE